MYNGVFINSILKKEVSCFLKILKLILKLR